MMIVKMLLYTGVRVSELISIKLSDVDFHYCQIRINKGKGSKDRIVPFPQSFKEMLAMHADSMKKKQAVNIRTGEYERFWPNIQRKPVLFKIYRRTSCDISC
jgi:integrase/recombinase XerD